MVLELRDVYALYDTINFDDFLDRFDAYTAVSLCAIVFGALISLRRNKFILRWAVNFLIVLLGSAGIRHLQTVGEKGMKLTFRYEDMFRIEAEREIVQMLIGMLTVGAVFSEKHRMVHILGVVVLGTGLLLAGCVFLLSQLKGSFQLIEQIDNFSIYTFLIGGASWFIFSLWQLALRWGEDIEETRNSCDRIPSNEFFAEGNINTLKELRKLRNMCKENPSLYQNLCHKERFESFLDNPRDVGVRL